MKQSEVYILLITLPRLSDNQSVGDTCYSEPGQWITVKNLVNVGDK